MYWVLWTIRPQGPQHCCRLCCTWGWLAVRVGRIHQHASIDFPHKQHVFRPDTNINHVIMFTAEAPTQKGLSKQSSPIQLMLYASPLFSLFSLSFSRMVTLQSSPSMHFGRLTRTAMGPSTSESSSALCPSPPGEASSRNSTGPSTCTIWTEMGRSLDRRCWRSSRFVFAWRECVCAAEY